MVRRYVWDNGHRLTIILIVLYGKMFIVMFEFGSNGSCDRRNHA
jgi:hypothetical protein